MKMKKEGDNNKRECLADINQDVVNRMQINLVSARFLLQFAPLLNSVFFFSLELKLFALVEMPTLFECLSLVFSIDANTSNRSLSLSLQQS